MFSRLEGHVRTQSSELIKKSQESIEDKVQKAVWDLLLSSTQDKFSFARRLAILTKKGESDYKTIADCYEDRNSIAHGGSPQKTIAMRKVISDLKKLYEVLKV